MSRAGIAYNVVNIIEIIFRLNFKTVAILIIILLMRHLVIALEVL